MKQIVLWVASISLALAAEARGQHVWEPASGAPFGTVTAAGTTLNGTIVIGMDNGRIYTSADSGTTWLLKTNGDLSHPNDFSLYPDGSAIIEGWISSDNGDTWKKSIWPRTIDSANRWIENGYSTFDTFRDGTFNYSTGITISSDQGHSWNYTPLMYGSANVGGFNNSIPQASQITPGIQHRLLLTLSDQLVLFSDSSYRSWPIRTTTLSWLFGNFVAGTSRGLLELVDTTWTKVSNGLPDTSIIAINSNRRGFAYITTPIGVYLSSNYGKNWQKLNTGNLSGAIVQGIATNDSRLFANKNGGFYYSLDFGKSWYKINHGLSTAAAWPIFVINDRLIAPNDSVVFQSTDHGNTWDISGGGSSHARRIAVTKNAIIGSSFMHGLVRSTDYGSNWDTLNVGLPRDPNGYYDFYGPFSDNCGHIFVYCWLPGCDDLYMSSDIGESWTRAANPFHYFFTQFVSNSKCEIFGCAWGGIFKSTNSGLDWALVSAGVTDTEFESLSVSKEDDLYALTYEGRVFHSTNDGNSWDLISSLKPSTYRSLVIDQFNNLYTYNDYGNELFLSTDKGVTWIDDTNGLDQPRVAGLAVSDDGFVYVASLPNGLFRSRISNLSVSEEITKQPTVTCASPNPLTTSTTIHFTLPKSEYITLTLYDISGREVRRVWSGEMDAGAHDVPFERGDLPAGVYFYRLSTGSESQMGSMVIE